MDIDEQIQTHILSVWKEEKKLFKHGSEGMLILTEKHLMFVSKTDAKMKWWEAATSRQLRTFAKSNNTMIHQDGYTETDLRTDLEKKGNLEISLDRILKIESVEKVWGTVLQLEINMGDKTKRYEFSVVIGWVKYPLKDPVKFARVDWTPFIEYIKSRQKIMMG